MDEYSRRRAGGGFVFSKKGSGLALRDSSDNKDQSAQICSRANCGSRLNSGKNIQINCADNAKSSRQSFRPSPNGKEVNGSSSRTSTLIKSPKKLYRDPRKKLPARMETDSETSSVHDEGEVSEPSPAQGETRSKCRAKPQDMVSREASLLEAGSSSSAPHSINRHGKRSAQRFGLSNLDSPSSPSMSMTFRDTNQGARKSTSTSKYNLRNLNCNSISDALQSGCSSSPESSLGSKKREMGRKGIGEAESSLSARGKKIGGPLLDDRRNDIINRGISISDSRRMRNLSLGKDNNEVTSVRTRRSNTRTRLPDLGNRNRLSLNEEPISTPVFPHPDISPNSIGLGAEFQYSEVSSSRSNSTSRPGSRSENARGGSSRSSGPHDVGISRSFMSRDGLRQYNLDGIAEVLLALERIEQDEELTYEQLLVLETNLFLGGLGYHDQHRDMRLDIDNMSYEELLALEERMGSVSTALSEEALGKCLKKSIYQAATSHEPASNGRKCNINDIKCSICQEEYNQGDELGGMECEHRYHVECIQQWLRLKNWCPICKASAAPSSPSASLPDP